MLRIPHRSQPFYVRFKCVDDLVAFIVGYTAAEGANRSRQQFLQLWQHLNLLLSDLAAILQPRPMLAAINAAKLFGGAKRVHPLDKIANDDHALFPLRSSEGLAANCLAGLVKFFAKVHGLSPNSLISIALGRLARPLLARLAFANLASFERFAAAIAVFLGFVLVSVRHCGLCVFERVIRASERAILIHPKELLALNFNPLFHLPAPVRFHVHITSPTGERLQGVFA